MGKEGYIKKAEHYRASFLLHRQPQVIAHSRNGFNPTADGHCVHGMLDRVSEAVFKPSNHPKRSLLKSYSGYMDILDTLYWARKSNCCSTPRESRICHPFSTG